MGQGSEMVGPKPLRSVESALAVLEALGDGGAEHSVTDLSRSLGMSKAAVYRALVTLRTCGYVRQNPSTDRYALTLKCRRLAMAAQEQFSFAPLAQPYLERLCAEVREAINLAVYEDGQAVYIAQVQSPQPIGVLPTPGGGGPAHCVATGKVLLAYQPDEVIEHVIARGLTKYTELTHATGESLRAELEQIRSNGYAINRGEWRSQVCGVAAPIRDHEGRVVASVGACGPIQHFSPGNVQHMIECVVATARAISEQLGWNPKSGVRAAS